MDTSLMRMDSWSTYNGPISAPLKQVRGGEKKKREKKKKRTFRLIFIPQIYSEFNKCVI